MKRTQLVSWEVRDFPLSHAQVQIPSEPCAVWDSSYKAFIGLHRMEPPSGVLADNTCLIEITIQHMSDSEANEAREMLLRHLDDRDERERKFWRWVAKGHKTVEVFRRERSSSFMYEVPCGDGSMLWVEADIQKTGQDEQYEEDEKAVRRIMSSVLCTKGTAKN